MFTQKKSSLFDTTKKASGSINQSSPTENGFLNYSAKKSAETRSGNGSLQYKTTGNPFVDQFGVLGSYKAPRTFKQIEQDCELLWAKNPLDAIKFTIYLRLITRKVEFPDGTSTETSQKGAELRYEPIMRMMWLHLKDEKAFWNNIGLFIAAGSWKDVIQMLSYDLQYHGWEGRVLNWNKFGGLILSGLANEKTSELVKKFLPQIKATSDCTTVEAQADTYIAKWICALLYGKKEGKAASGTYRSYRKLKSSGTAHEWQQLISQRKFQVLDFNKIHGRALNQLVRSKFLKNQGLSEVYEKWVTKAETVKYTGFVHELFGKLPRLQSQLPFGERETINKQFAELVAKGKSQEMPTKFLVVRDTSGSMGAIATGTSQSCYDIAKALALYFSEFLSGTFAGSWMEFNSTAQMHQWVGNTPLDKWYNDHTSFIGSTDFQSVINWFCAAKKSNRNIPESDFPTGIICISDNMFDPSDLGETNVETARKKLVAAGFSKEYCDNFVIALWNLSSSAYGGRAGKQFETFGKAKNTFYFSGYSASVISFLHTCKIESDEDLVNAALSQELLERVTLD